MKSIKHLALRLLQSIIIRKVGKEFYIWSKQDALLQSNIKYKKLKFYCRKVIKNKRHFTNSEKKPRMLDNFDDVQQSYESFESKIPIPRYSTTLDENYQRGRSSSNIVIKSPFKQSSLKSFDQTTPFKRTPKQYEHNSLFSSIQQGLRQKVDQVKLADLKTQSNIAIVSSQTALFQKGQTIRDVLFKSYERKSNKENKNLKF